MNQNLLQLCEDFSTKNQTVSEKSESEQSTANERDKSEQPVHVLLRDAP